MTFTIGNNTNYIDENGITRDLSTEIKTKSAYIIELARWGIIQGLPTKHIEVIASANVNCYADADYVKAYNNIIGINNALSWAYGNGYREVIMPFGTYSLCHSNISNTHKENKIVIDYDNFTFDLNNSTFKVMFDSGKRSPYDMMQDFPGSTGPYYISTREPWQMGNVGVDNGFGTFLIINCSFSTLKNGKLIGDKIDRDFAVRLERTNESTYGVVAGGNSRHITVHNMDISLFMGDGTMCAPGTTPLIKGFKDVSWQVADLDANGLVVASTTRCVSDYIAVQEATSYFVRGLGSTSGFTNLRNKKHATYCYDASKVFIGRLSDSYVLRGFKTIKNTAFIRFVVEEYKTDPQVAGNLGGWYAFLYKGLYGEFTTFSNNYIHHNHRGGHSQCLNDTLIINSLFYNNGETTDFENGLPGFETPGGSPEPTRFHINVEDVSGFNTKVIGNRFDGGRFGVALRGHSCIIKDNYFKDNIGVILYRQHHAVVRDNYFDNSSFDTSPYNKEWNDLIDYIRHWHIDGNTFDGLFAVRGTAVIHSISNNIFKDQLIMESKVDIFSKNTFIVDKLITGGAEYFQLKLIDTFEHCVFKKNTLTQVSNSFSIWNALLINCTFTNLRANLQDVELKNCIITDSSFQAIDRSIKFKDCKFNYGTYLVKPVTLIGDNSAMIVASNVYTPQISLEFINCDITSAHSHALFSTYLNVVMPINLKLENVKITRTAFSKMGFDKFQGAYDFKNVTITSAVAAGNFVPNASLSHKFIDCAFTGISFTVKTSDIQYTQSDIILLAKPLIGSGAPATVPQKIGQEYYDTTNLKLYKAFGTASAADWIIMN